MADPSGFPQSEPPNSSLPKIKSIFDFNAESLEEVAVWLEQRGLTTPVTQLVGFSQFTTQTSTGTDAFNGTLTAGANTSAAGPSISALPAGKYVIFASYVGTADQSVVNQTWTITGGGGTIVSVQGELTNGGSFSNIGFVSLSAASNDITSTYSAQNGAASNRSWSFSSMAIAALRYANA